MVSAWRVIKRTIEISREPSHLTVRNRQLLILRKTEPPRTLPANPPNLAGSIPSEDIGIVLVDEPQTSYSHAALAELADRGAVLVVCGRNHLPTGLLLPLSEHTEVVWRLKDQIKASRPLRKQLWKQIIQAKIRAQAAALPSDAPGREAGEMLLALAREVKSGDAENHEAQAARIYWSAWLGRDAGPEAAAFQRDSSPGTDASPPNNLLNYGYAVLRAATARALVGAGLLPALGLKHKNRSNAFCLADDLMEPLRPLADQVARDLFLSGERHLIQPVKARLLQLLVSPVHDADGDDRIGPLMVALHRYAASLAACLASGRAGLSIPVSAIALPPNPDEPPC